MTFRARRRRRTATATRISSAAKRPEFKGCDDGDCIPNCDWPAGSCKKKCGKTCCERNEFCNRAQMHRLRDKAQPCGRATARRRAAARTAHVAASTRGAQPAAVPTRRARRKERSRRSASASRARAGRAARTAAPTTNTASRRSSRTSPRPLTGRPATSDAGSGAPSRAGRTAAALATSARGGNASSTADRTATPAYTCHACR